MKSFDGVKEWHESWCVCGSQLDICISDATSSVMRNNVLTNVQNEIGRVMNSIKLRELRNEIWMSKQQ